MRSVLIGVFLAALPTLAARAAERPATAGEIKAFAVGRDLSCGGALLHFGADGGYAHNGGEPGRYRILAGRICIDFDNGAKRCDGIVVNGQAYTLVGGDGQRLPCVR